MTDIAELIGALVAYAEKTMRAHGVGARSIGKLRSLGDEAATKLASEAAKQVAMAERVGALQAELDAARAPTPAPAPAPSPEPVPTDTPPEPMPEPTPEPS